MSGIIKVLGLISKLLGPVLLYVGVISQDQVAAGNNERVLGGVQAKNHEFPFLLTGGSSGSLIRPSWGLTAAHCIAGSYLPFPMWAGRIEGITGVGDKPEPQAVERNVTKILIHPGYVRKGAKNDIGLMKFDAPFEYNDVIQPVTLVAKGYDEKECTWVASYVKHCPGTHGGHLGCNGTELSFKQRKVDLPIQENAVCEELYPQQFNRTTMICAGYDEGGKDTCTGDSGYPQLVIKDGKHVLVGLTSWGPDPCGQPKLYAGYTRVATFIDWIEETIRKEEEENGKS